MICVSVAVWRPAPLRPASRALRVRAPSRVSRRRQSPEQRASGFCYVRLLGHQVGVCMRVDSPGLHTGLQNLFDPRAAQLQSSYSCELDRSQAINRNTEFQDACAESSTRQYRCFASLIYVTCVDLAISNLFASVQARPHLAVFTYFASVHVEQGWCW